MRALVHDPQPHDSFFLYCACLYILSLCLTVFRINSDRLDSGHAVQIEDLDGDESDGFDECLFFLCLEAGSPKSIEYH
jgi:hypothetical protein